MLCGLGLTLCRTGLRRDERRGRHDRGLGCDSGRASGGRVEDDAAPGDPVAPAVASAGLVAVVDVAAQYWGSACFNPAGFYSMPYNMQSDHTGFYTGNV